MIPRANSWAPLKIAMIEARKAKPGDRGAVREIVEEDVEEDQRTRTT